MFQETLMEPITSATSSLRREFLPSGYFDQDAEELAEIYGIMDIEWLARDLLASSKPRAFDRKALAKHIMAADPDNEELLVLKFIVHCRLAIIAHRVLMRI